MFKPTAVVIGAFVEELKRLPAGVPASEDPPGEQNLALDARGVSPRGIP